MLLFLTSNWRLVSVVCVLDVHPPFGDVLSPLVWIAPCPTDPTMMTTTKKSIFVSLNFSNASPGPFVNGVELKNVGRPFFSFRYDSTVTTLPQILLPRYASRPADQCPAIARPVTARVQHASMILDHEVSLIVSPNLIQLRRVVHVAPSPQQQ